MCCLPATERVIECARSTWSLAFSHSPSLPWQLNPMNSPTLGRYDAVAVAETFFLSLDKKRKYSQSILLAFGAPLNYYYYLKLTNSFPSMKTVETLLHSYFWNRWTCVTDNFITPLCFRLFISEWTSERTHPVAPTSPDRVTLEREEPKARLSGKLVVLPRQLA